MSSIQTAGARPSGSTLETLAEGHDAPKPPGYLEAPLEPGSTLSRYMILHVLGSGGMGVVYAAYDPELDRKVAIKVLRRRKSSGTAHDEDKARMLREAQALARLQHPNVVAVHDVGMAGDRVFLAMDFVEGRNLRQWKKECSPDWRRIVDVYLQAGRGLAAAHAAGLVHRDFKPDNALLSSDGRVLVLDFGLARARRTASDASAPSPSHPSDALIERMNSSQSVSLDAPLTSGGLQGTPSYMAPEQHLAEPTDERTDQFSFCVSLWETLYGELPFAGDSATAIAFAALEGKLKDPPRSSVPPWVRRILERGLARAPDDRHESMHALLAALARDPHQTTRRAALAGLAVAGVAGATWWSAAAGSGTPCTTGTERVAGVWNDARATAVQQAFQGTGRPHADASFTTVDRVLDDYASQWATMHRDACEATHVRGQQSDELLDLRMLCLNRRLEGLDAVLRHFTGADGTVVDHAVEAVRDLSSVDECADALGLRAHGSAPKDPEHRRRVEALHRQLAELQAGFKVGKRAELLPLAQSVVEQAAALGPSSELAEAKLILALAHEAVGDYAEAKEILFEAAELAEALHHGPLLGRIRTELVMVVGDRLAAVEEGRLWGRLARSVLEREKASPARFAELENNLAHVAERSHDFEEVQQRQRRMLDLLETADDVHDTTRAGYLANYSATLADLGELDEAMAHAREALELWETSLSPDHPDTAFGHSAIALVHDAARRPHDALQRYDRAIEILERALGPEHPGVIEMRNNAGIAALRLGDLDRARGEFELVLKFRRQHYGEEHIEVASAMGNLAAFHRYVEEPHEALDYARKSLALRERLLPETHPDLASGLVNMANVLEDLEQFDEVVRLRQRALSILEANYGASHPRLVVDLANLAYSQLRAGDRQDASRNAERALAASQTFENTPQDERAFAEIVMARVLAESSSDTQRIRALVDAAKARMEGLHLEAEKRLLREIGLLLDWPDLSEAHSSGPPK